eukprot:g3870.t1
MDTVRRWFNRFCVVFALAAAPFSLGTAVNSGAADAKVVVFAAASMKNALDNANAAWATKGHHEVAASYAASSALAKQIENGAPADLFISADVDWMSYLEKKNLVKEDTRTNWLGNRIVLVAPKGKSGSVDLKPGMDLRGLLDGGKLAMGAPDSVPAGKYAKAALEKLGVWSSVEESVAGTESVRCREQKGAPMTLRVDVQHRLGTFEIRAAFTSEGGITALFGRSGSGKTSLMRVIAGLERADRARLEIDGETLVDTERRIFVPVHKRRFGYVFQEARLFPHLTVRQNLIYGQRDSGRGGLADFDRVISLLGIEGLLGRGPNALSGGEGQRVAIGRALLSSPRMLLMDEPLAALDEERKQEILPYLERLRDEIAMPIVYVSHSIAEVARLADEVVVMRDGRVEATGSPAEIFSSSGFAATAHRDGGSVLAGTVTMFDEDSRLAMVQLRGFSVLVPDLHQIVGSTVRIFIPERDVIVAAEQPRRLSALNIIGGDVDAVEDAGNGAVRVSMRCGGEILSARITRLSADRLQLQQGVPIFAVLKTIALQR